MSRKYKFHNPDGIYFTSFAVKDWVDVFTRIEYKNILIDSLAFCQREKGLEIFAWCIMTNHVHLIIRAKEGYRLENVLRDFKGYTSKSLLKAITENPEESRKEWLLEKFRLIEGNRFWGMDNHPVELWSNDVINQKLTYLHNNPVQDGMVFQPEQYVYSSAIDYAGQRGLLDIIIIE